MIRRREGRGDYRTWLLLVLALVPTWSVLAGAGWLWNERGEEIADFEEALLPVDVTYEVFLINHALLQAEASLIAAALPEAGQDVLDRAQADRDRALAMVERSEQSFVPVLEAMLATSADENLDVETLSLIGGSLGLAADLLESQTPGQPPDPGIAFLTSLARDTAAGLVLPFVHAGDREATYFYDVLSSTIKYQDQLDRDRLVLFSSLGSPASVSVIESLRSSLIREAGWRTLTDDRTFVGATSAVDWDATVVINTAPVFLDETEPAGAILSELPQPFGSADRDALVFAMMELDDKLMSDVSVAHAELHRESDEYLAGLVSERLLMAATSTAMTIVALGLAGLTIAEVRGRRRVEIAHDEALHQLGEKADRDPTTGVWNRRRLEADVERLIEETQQSGSSVILAYLDLDHFKAVNDVWGHNTGDQVLRTITQRLQNFEHYGTTFELCRFGGDEFVLYTATTQRSFQWLEDLGESLIRRVSPEMEIDGRRHEVGVSVGIASSTEDSNIDSLLLEADSSLLLAKRERGTAVVYNRMVSRTGELVHALPQALASGEFSAHIQPVVSLETGEICHVEALARWRRPNGETVSPAVFVPLVESYGLAEALTSTIIGRVKQLVDLESTPSDVHVWINVSPRELDVANFAERFVSILRDHDMDPRRVGIEITETAAVREPHRLGRIFRQLREVGISIAIDDFGNGYSPLGYLRILPADTVKLDRSLIANIDTDKANQHLVTGIVGLVTELGMSLVAEGVEREQEAEWLIAHGITQAQGFLFGRPEPAIGFDWSARRSARTEIAAS